MGRTSNARERLIESGRELMHERGYSAVGVAEICARADVNKGSFYYFFDSKQALAIAVIDGYRKAVLPLLAELVADDLPPLERLSRFFDRTYETHDACRREHGRVLGCALGNLALEMSTQDAEVRDRLGGVFDDHIDHFERLIAEAVARGDLPSLDARRAASALLALVEGGVMLAKTRNDPELLHDLKQDAWRLLGKQRSGT